MLKKATLNKALVTKFRKNRAITEKCKDNAFSSEDIKPQKRTANKAT